MDLQATSLKCWYLLAIVNCISLLLLEALDVARFLPEETVWVFQLTSSLQCAEQLAKDVELFAQHAGRKSIKMEDVILTGTSKYHVLLTPKERENIWLLRNI